MIDKKDELRANIACKEAIEKAINDNYDYINRHLNTKDALETVEAEFSKDCILHVLANTIQSKLWDGRISEENKEWAKKIPIEKIQDAWGGISNRYFVIDQVHVGLTNMFATMFRKQIAGIA